MTELAHLARRFLGALRARPLRPTEQAEVAARLRDGELVLFWQQGRSDRRHAADCARRVAAAAPGRPDLTRAALLHDVGKRSPRVGVLARVLASALALLRLPVPGRLGAYLGHGPRGADDLEALGAEALVTGYARHHHGPRPADIAPGDWDLLGRADRL